MVYFIQSERLGFRHWCPEDASLAQSLWRDPEVMRHMGGAYDEAGADARLALEMRRQISYGVQYWPIFQLSTGAHVGCAGLRPFHDEAGVLEVGVHLARAFWSGRYGEEAARAVIQYGFDTLRLDAIVAGHGPDNVNSKLLLGRLDFTFSHEEPWGEQGVLHPYYRLDRRKYDDDKVI
jgi:ribosomal-protein-alanine N-acetyltransferase